MPSVSCCSRLARSGRVSWSPKQVLRPTGDGPSPGGVTLFQGGLLHPYGVVG